MSDDKKDMKENGDDKLRKKNRALGLALFAFVLIVAVVSYFKVKSLAP